MNNFNPNDVGVANGNMFGLPVTKKNADLIIIPVCSDITASFGKGTAKAPKAILKASLQVDLYDNNLKNAWENKIFMLPISKREIKQHQKIEKLASQLINKLADGEAFSEHDNERLASINAYCREMNQHVKTTALEHLNNGKTVAVLGGDHNSPLGLIEALAEKHTNFGVLQIDAHADLRIAYEGFEFSHASIAHNALKQKQVTKLVQVGIRDICQQEIDYIKNSKGKISTFFDWEIKKQQFEGKTWAAICDEIIAELPQKVYITYDIDALDPKLCPNTGTPVPGGFEYEQINYLINQLVESKKQIIGFDLNEVGNNDWDANVGARILFKLCNALKKSQQTVKVKRKLQEA